MRLEVSVEIPFPRERVYDTYRDRLPELVPYLPNVRGIDQLSRVDEGSVVKLVNHWRGGGDIPAAARAFLSENLLAWHDYATWDRAAFTTHWRTEVGAFKDAVRAEGQNTYEVVGESVTRLLIRGAIEVDARKIKGVPRLLAGSIGPAVEAVLVAAVKPNLVSVAQGVGKYLRDNPSG